MYTIKSESSEGTYFLVNHWKKQKTFWKLASEIKKEDMFQREQDAKRSLSMLLKVMPEYLADKFTMIKIDENNKIISETKIAS